MIAVVDYKKGNIRSVVRGIEATGADVVVTDDPAALDHAKAIVLPGVGAFRDAMDSMNELGLSEKIARLIEGGVPYLGICLGMHVMFEGGTEHSEDGIPCSGLGILPGIVDRLPHEGYGEDGEIHSFKLPHVGWNTVDIVSESSVCDTGELQEENPSNAATASPLSPSCANRTNAGCPSLLDGLPDSEYFYFTHSFACPGSPYTVGTTRHSIAFPSIVRKGDAWGVQFHPEKSSAAGARLLSNFVNAYD